MEGSNCTNPTNSFRLPTGCLPGQAAGTSSQEVCVSASNFYNVTITGYYNGASTGFTGHTAGATAYVTFQVSGATTNTATDLAAGEELWFELAFSRTLRP